MNPKHWAWIVPVIVIGLITLAILGAVISWILMSYQTFPRRAKPGGTFQVGDRTYRIPALRHKVWGSSQEPTMDREIPMLSEALLKSIRDLTIAIMDVLRRSRTPFWAAGGTLISAMLWKANMCFDDDIDLGVDWRDRDYLWSPEFAQLLDEAGLEAFHFKWCSVSYVPSQNESMLRLRRKGTECPTCDLLFFRQRPEDGKWAKVDSWNDAKQVYTYNAPDEIWEPDWLYPLREVQVDGMWWPVPHKAEETLDVHYGTDWNKLIKSPNPLFKSHQWAFTITSLTRVWQVIEPRGPAEPHQLINPRFWCGQGKNDNVYQLKPDTRICS